MSSPPPASREPDEQDQGSAAGGTGPWQAVFSPEANAWYFWNSETGQTTWENPLESSSTPTVPAPATDSATAAASAASTSEAAPAPAPADPTALPPIDPELAWLDPSAAARTSSTGAQLARFNARTGRFQVDPSMNPDRISDFQRSNRQQEAYFDASRAGNQAVCRRWRRRGRVGDEEEAVVEADRAVQEEQRGEEAQEAHVVARVLSEGHVSSTAELSFPCCESIFRPLDPIGDPLVGRRAIAKQLQAPRTQRYRIINTAL